MTDEGVLELTETVAGDVGELHRRLLDAVNAYATAQTEEREARSRATDCLNELNAAQRYFDTAVEQIRTLAPSGSDWATKAETPFPFINK